MVIHNSFLAEAVLRGGTNPMPLTLDDVVNYHRRRAQVLFNLSDEYDSYL